MSNAFVAPAPGLSRDEQGGGARYIRLPGRSYMESSETLPGSVRVMYQEVVEARPSS